MRTLEDTRKILDEKTILGKVSLFIPEVLKFAGTLKPEDKIKCLTNNMSNAMKEIFRITYSPKVEKVVTAEQVKDVVFQDIDISDYGMAPTSMFREFKRLNLFTTERGVKLSKDKLNILMSQMKSSLYKDDNEMIDGIFAGDLPYEGIDIDVAKELFPEMFEVEDGKES